MFMKRCSAIIFLACTYLLLHPYAALASLAQSSSSAQASSSSVSSPALTFREKIEYLFEPESNSIEFYENDFSEKITDMEKLCKDNKDINKLFNAYIKHKQAAVKVNNLAESLSFIEDKENIDSTDIKNKHEKAKQNAARCSAKYASISGKMSTQNEIAYSNFLASLSMWRAQFFSLKLAKQQTEMENLKYKTAHLKTSLADLKAENAALRAQLPQQLLPHSDLQPCAHKPQLTIFIKPDVNGQIPTKHHEKGTVYFPPRVAKQQITREFHKLIREVSTQTIKEYFNINKLVESKTARKKLRKHLNTLLKNYQANKGNASEKK